MTEKIYIKRSDIGISVSVQPEPDGPEGSFASGDEDADKEQAARIRKEAEWNEWAWCLVTVTAKFGEHVGEDHLGGCSYKDEDDFRQPGGYFDDMQREAIAQLITRIQSHIPESLGVEVVVDDTGPG